VNNSEAKRSEAKTNEIIWWNKLVWCKFAALGLKNCENNFKFPPPQDFQTKTKSFQDNQNQVINPSINNGS
jgi:hypothetical protein